MTFRTIIDTFRYMAKLLCVTPWPGLKTHNGRIPAALIPYWSSHFSQIDVWSTYGAPVQGEDPVPGVAESWYPVDNKPLQERLPELGGLITQGGYTHIWVVGDMAFLRDLAGMGLIHDRLPNQLIYAYALIDTPFIDTQYVRVAEFYDFFVTMGGMALGAYKELVTELGDNIEKGLFKAVMRAKSIMPGVDTKTFRPLDVHRKEPSYEEIREALFGDKLNSQDLLVMVSGQKTRQKGIPQACATVAALKKELEPDRKVKVYFHMPCRPIEGRPLQVSMFAAGCDLDPDKDVLYGDGLFNPDGSITLPDEDLNLLYNAADIVLCTDVANSWCFTATEAMAAGTVVAAPGDHVYLDVVAGRGVELPATEFTWAPWGNNEYVRAVDPVGAAKAIAEVVKDLDRFDNAREAGIHWAFYEETSTWSYCAEEWLAAFGML